MNDITKQDKRMVIAKQLEGGYYEKINGVIYHREYHVLRNNRDGTLWVEDPRPRSR